MFVSEVFGIGYSHSLHSKCLAHVNVASSLLQIVTNPFDYPSGDEKEKKRGWAKAWNLNDQYLKGHCDLKKKIKKILKKRLQAHSRKKKRREQGKLLYS